MGVRGTRRLLQDVGWLPPDDEDDDNAEDDVHIIQDREKTTSEVVDGQDEDEEGKEMASSNGRPPAESSSPTKKTLAANCCGCSTSLWRRYDPRNVLLAEDQQHEEQHEEILPTSFVVGNMPMTSSERTNNLQQSQLLTTRQDDHLPPLRRIFPPTNSNHQKQVVRLLIDGNGLAFHLHGIAYARYLRSLLSAGEAPSQYHNHEEPNSSTSSSPPPSCSSCPTIRQLESMTITNGGKNKNRKKNKTKKEGGASASAGAGAGTGSVGSSSSPSPSSKIAQALPCMMPLSFLRQVTTEFIEDLCQSATNSSTSSTKTTVGRKSANENLHHDPFHHEHHRQQHGLGHPTSKQANNATTNHKLHVEVFWDGKYRPIAKAATEQERKERRIEEESNLQMFCRFGTLPQIRGGKGRYRHSKSYACQFKDSFPFSKLFTTCVRHAIDDTARKYSDSSVVTVTSRVCVGEADIDLSKEASGDPCSYVLAYDSDFLFFRDVNYIPLDQIAVSSGSSSPASSSTISRSSQGRDPRAGIFAFVARRKDLAHLLGLDDSQMIDLALLMGNDYVDPTVLDGYIQLRDQSYGQHPSTGQTCARLSTPDIVSHLQHNNDFVVTSVQPEYQRSIDFVRRLYNLELNFEDEGWLSVMNHYSNGHDADNDDDKNGRIAVRELKLTLQDTSLQEALLRHFEYRLDNNADERNAVPISSSAIDALRDVWKNGDSSHRLSCFESRRPTWEETLAATYIERCVYQLYNNSSDQLLVRGTPPELVFDRLQFNSRLALIVDSMTLAENQAEEERRTSVAPPTVLPIDEYEKDIIDTIQQNRVTIIHGETGCGKSSRLPIMLLNAPPPDQSLTQVKFFISQPRRIAAKALVERVRSCEPTHKDRFALRMGHGWKEYESNKTQVWFVTTGYLVRLLANHPEKFNDCSHLVVDEVHERSVDTDILCLLCRRLLHTNPTIRLVLMSATLATKLYRDYFNVPNEPIHVGTRRYPITEYFLEDLQKDDFGLPKQEKAAVSAIVKEIENKRCRVAPSSAEMEKRFALVARLTTIIGEPGSSVLIFVPGMGEIVAISEALDNIHVAGIEYKCFPIHSDVPFEEQMSAFDDPQENEVKVIIATNAAESSVTLPSVDHVICLGLCRQIVYNQQSHRQMLSPTWISKASATQRAGRTGRVRPGSVYRIYTRSAYEHYMEEFEPGEMVRIPLDSVILLLKQILSNEEVKPVFMECLEPPKLDTIDRSFQSLNRWGFLDAPNDQADITSLGSFVSSLGVDLSLGSFIGLGIQFGLAAEAIEMASMMSLPKTPFQIASPMWLDSKSFNSKAPDIFMSKNAFDAGLYSEPMALMNALWDYSATSKKSSWYHKHRFAAKRWQQVVSSRDSLRKRVAEFLGIDEARLQVQLPPRDMPPAKVAILRILCVWVFSDSIAECAPSKLKINHDGSVAVTVKSTASKKLDETYLKQILNDERHPHTLVESNIIEQKGTFECDNGFSLLNADDELEQRLISYMCEKQISAALLCSEESFFLYLDTELTSATLISDFSLKTLDGVLDSVSLVACLYADAKRRGMKERACGLWSVQNQDKAKGSINEKRNIKRLSLGNFVTADYHAIWSRTLQELYASNMKSTITCYFPVPKKKKKAKLQTFDFSLRGECRPLSKTALTDLLGKTPSFVSTETKSTSQSIVFYKSQKEESNRTNALLEHDMPEGVRMIATMACSQRKGPPRLRFPHSDQGSEDEEHNKNKENTIDFKILPAEVDVSKRWRRLNSDDMVFVEDSVAASAIHTTQTLFAVAANALELQKGGLRVECLTLLPPNPLFLLLSLLTFGLDPVTSFASTWSTPLDSADDRAARLIKKSMAWLDGNKARGPSCADEFAVGVHDESNQASTRSAIRQRLLDAIEFNKSTMNMGEKLVCFPDHVDSLCNLFDNLDDTTTVKSWDTLHDEGLTESNLELWRQEYKVRRKPIRFTRTKMKDIDDSDDEIKTDHRAPADDGKYSRPTNKANSSQQKGKGKSLIDTKAIQVKENKNLVKPRKQNGETKNSPKSQEHSSRRKHVASHALRTFDDRIMQDSLAWFATTPLDGHEMPDFPSTNILALVFYAFGQQFMASLDDESRRHQDEFIFTVSLDSKNWEIVTINDDNKGGSTILYKARFINPAIDHVPVYGRGKNKLPKWVKKGKDRPSKLDDAKSCVPSSIDFPDEAIEIDGHGLAFKSLYGAIQMESAFWLEKQFCYAGKKITRHWYDHTFDQMLEILIKQATNLQL